MNFDIEAIILYCSIDRRFLKPCVENLIAAGIQCHVIMYDHLYGRTPEPQEIMDEAMALKSSHCDVTILRHRKNQTPLWHEAMARHMGIKLTKAKYLLFIDANEIVEPIRFRDWLEKGTYKNFKSIKLGQYLYAIRPQYQLKKKAYNTILARTNWVQTLPFREEARFNAYWNNRNLLSRWMGKLGLNPWFTYYRGKRFIHHYTGVRTLPDMVTKVENWSHKPDRDDWVDVVVLTFYSANKKYIAGSRYKEVPNYFNIDETNLYKLK